MNLPESIDPPAPRQVWLRDYTAGLSTGAKVTYTINVGGGTSQSTASTTGSSLSGEDYTAPQAALTPEPPGASTPGELVELILENQAHTIADSNVPLLPDADVNLVLDDGSYEWLYGYGDLINDKSNQFIWLIALPPAPASTPST